MDIPPFALAEARKRYSGNDRWKNFACHILRHPEIRRRLWLQHEGQCDHCSRLLKPTQFTIHHLSYDHSCVTNQTVRLRSARGRCPPCQNCDAVADCLERLAVLCRLCHHRLHRPQSRK